MLYILVNLSTFKGIWRALITLKKALAGMLYNFFKLKNVKSNIEGRIQGIVLT